MLPRGKGIVTRSPIEIQLIRLINTTEEWVCFSGSDEKIKDFTLVCERIKEETEKLAGNSKGITSLPIRLKFYSPKVLNLVIIDLPGLTKNPVGDQPEDIEDIIRNTIIMPYISNKNSIILAVSKANDDIANSESLKMAREVDPEGDRTIGVLTKLDLMDKGTDVSNELNNTTYKLKLGYVGVVCRGPNDISEGKTLQQQTETEKIFFETHPAYSRLSKKMGIPFLNKKLNANFMLHIKEALPDIRKNIIHYIKQKDDQLSSLGEFFNFPDDSSKGRQILNWIQKFVSTFKDVIFGKTIKKYSDQVQGGSRINTILYNIYVKGIQEYKGASRLTTTEIKSAILNCSGINSPLIVSEQAFYTLVKDLILDLKNPSLCCAQEIYEEMRQILYSMEFPELKNYGNIVNALRQEMENLLEETLKPTESTIKTLFEIELTHINVKHPDFQDCHDSLKRLYFNNVPTSAIKLNAEDSPTNHSSRNRLPYGYQENDYDESDQDKDSLDSEEEEFDFASKTIQRNISEEKDEENDSDVDEFDEDLLHNNPYYRKKDEYQGYMEEVPQKITIKDVSLTLYEEKSIRMLRNIIESYFSIVKKSVGDFVPKTIITYLIHQTLNTAETKLIQGIYKVESFDHLIEENSKIGKKRKSILDNMAVLKRCLAALDNIGSKFK